MKSPIIRATILTCMKIEEVESITNVKDKRNFPEDNIKSNHGSESQAQHTEHSGLWR